MARLWRRIPCRARCRISRSRSPEIIVEVPLKNVLILGVNGFIGHHLSKYILAHTDWHIYGMDLQSERVGTLLANPRFHFVEGDITINLEWVEYHVRKCDVILPLVALAPPPRSVREPLRASDLDFEAN